jgi:hypothetical protein
MHLVIPKDLRKSFAMISARRVFQFIASGLLGADAFHGAWAIASLSVQLEDRRIGYAKVVSTAKHSSEGGLLRGGREWNYQIMHEWITLQQMLHEWAMHDLGHVRQIAELVRARKHWQAAGRLGEFYQLRP